MDSRWAALLLALPTARTLSSSSQQSLIEPAVVESSPLPLDSLARSELSTDIQIGDASVSLVSVSGFQVGGVIRLHPGYPNQEDHRIRAISHKSLWLASAGLEFEHMRKEAVEMLAIVPDCPNN